MILGGKRADAQEQPRYPCCGHCKSDPLPQGHANGCGYHFCVGNQPLSDAQSVTLRDESTEDAEGSQIGSTSVLEACETGAPACPGCIRNGGCIIAAEKQGDAE